MTTRHNFNKWLLAIIATIVAKPVHSAQCLSYAMSGNLSNTDNQNNCISGPGGPETWLTGNFNPIYWELATGIHADKKNGRVITSCAYYQTSDPGTPFNKFIPLPSGFGIPSTTDTFFRVLCEYKHNPSQANEFRAWFAAAILNDNYCRKFGFEYMLDMDMLRQLWDGFLTDTTDEAIDIIKRTIW